MGLPKVIYLMGLPGAGKGTQAELLAQAIGYHRFSTGSSLRAVAQEQTELGRKVKALIDNGYLASPQLAAEIVKQAVSEQLKQGKGIVFDGTPRTLEEAKIIDAFFSEQQYCKPLVIFLKVDKQAMMERNLKRHFCLGLTNDFSVLTAADKERCLKLGGTVGTRVDDAPEKFDTRWREFQERTMPVVDYYRDLGLLHEIDGMPPISEVTRRIMEIIKKCDPA